MGKEKKKEAKESSKVAAQSKASTVASSEAELDEQLNDFSLECEKIVKDSSVKVQDAIEDVVETLTEDEFLSVRPMACLFERMLKHCRMKDEKEVFALVLRFKPLIDELIGRAKMHRFKVKILTEAQKIAYKMGLP